MKKLKLDKFAFWTLKSGLILSLGICNIGFAQDYETTVEETVFSTSSKVILDKAAIEKTRATTLAGVLATQANIVVAANPFQPSSIYLRGSDAGYVLILIDGVPVYDASTTQRTLNLNSIDVRSVERIEIIKGGQSVLFGGQAAGGVIKITTVSGLTVVPKVLLQASHLGGVDAGIIGSKMLSEESSLTARLFAGAKENKSPVKNSSEEYPAQVGSFDLIYLMKNNSADMMAKLVYAKDNIRLSTTNQTSPYQSLDSDNFKQESELTSLAWSSTFKAMPMKPKLAVTATTAERTYSENSQSGSIVLGADDVYKGTSLSTRLDLEALRSEYGNLDFGLSAVNEALNYNRNNSEVTDKQQTSYGTYLKVEKQVGEVVLAEVGTRYDKLDVVGERNSSHLGLSFWKNTRLEFSNSFRNPSLFHLYSNYGNKNLKIESGIHSSLSHDLQINDQSQLSATVFRSEFKDLIGTTGNYPNLKYNNISKALIQGIELIYSLRFAEEYLLNASMGYQDPWDQTSKKWLTRRPLSSGSLQLSKNWETHAISTQVRMAGSRYDSSKKLPGYAIIGITWNEKYSEALNLYGRVDNLADYKYEEFSGYFNRGLEATAGLEYMF